jgi:hypothetical protein
MDKKEWLESVTAISHEQMLASGRSQDWEAFAHHQASFRSIAFMPAERTIGSIGLMDWTPVERTIDYCAITRDVQGT